ncbi:GspH/FimT family pseudopilin [Psychromonas ossibalaenae]|uniref:GspH/FimT family pseudopilin n=1 Tax=Psychromonas ossibalaenae TaxID=444922 RepID=UPI0003772DAC|nr:GspH/FimT family pseudopilin [Psychromonas ossibalaenae]
MKIERCKNTGFTLIELLVSVLIVAILVAITTSSYRGIVARQALQDNSERLFYFLQLAKTESVKLNEKVYVHFCQFENSTKWDMAMTTFPACDCFTADSCLLNGTEKIQELTDGKVLVASASDITFSGKQASYSPMRFSVNAGSVRLTNSQGQKLKVIQSTMRLRICSPDKAQLGYGKC